jgi:hypothetical protein
MRTVRPRRRGYFDLRRITLGDYIVLASSLVTLISLFLPWFVSTIPGQHSEWAFTYSPWVSVIVIVFFLATLFLAIYPAVAAGMGLPPMPFGVPLPYMIMGIVLLLSFDFQLGKYGCIECQGTSRGFGIYLGLIASAVYIIGSIIRWSSRPAVATRGEI